MPWRLLVIRPDSPIRYWCTGRLDCLGEIRRLFGNPSLVGFPLRRHIFLGTGATHIRSEELDDLGAVLGGIEAEQVDLFQRIGHHFEELGAEWLSYCATHFTEGELTAATNDHLIGLVDGFCERFTRYAPILYVPHIIESRFASEYETVLSELAKRLLASHDDLYAFMPSATAANERTLVEYLRKNVEHSPRRTMGEDRAARIAEVASIVSSDASLRSFAMTVNFLDPVETRRRYPDIYTRIEACLQEFGWIKHWGYPPSYRSFTYVDFATEIAAALDGIPPPAHKETSLPDHRVDAHQATLRAGRQYLSGPQAQLLEDVGYYNFLRTYRMEVLIRAEYLSVALFREVERRLFRESPAIQADDVFWLLPPEIVAMLAGGPAPDDLALRRNGEWALVTDAAAAKGELLTGQAYHEFVTEFYAAVDGRENARGTKKVTDPSFTGGKGASLATMRAAQIPVPDFFVVTTDAYAVAAKGEAQNAQNDSQAIPEPILHAAEKLVGELGLTRLAVRSSAVVEDSGALSWAGQFDSVIGVTRAEMARAIRQVWDSLHMPRPEAYAAEHGVQLTDIGMAVIVQRLVDAEISGVINTRFDLRNPSYTEIEVAWGLGEAIVGGHVTPDRYIVELTDGQLVIHDQAHAKQSRALTLEGWRDLPADQASAAKLTKSQLVELIQMGQRLEALFAAPQDIEFAYADDKLYILQSRPQTDLQGVSTSKAVDIPAGAKLVGQGLKGKVATVMQGRVQVIRSLSEADTFERGNVLAIQAATPAWDPIIFRAGALLTDEGGATSHAIRVANERGIPAIVGLGRITSLVEDGSTLVLDTESDPFVARVYELRG